jgi:hypothetical protein
MRCASSFALFAPSRLPFSADRAGAFVAALLSMPPWPYNRGEMDSRHKIRELALQVLFTFDAQNRADAELAHEVTLPAAGDAETVRKVTEMATAAWEARKTADAWSTPPGPAVAEPSSAGRRSRAAAPGDLGADQHRHAAEGRH